VPGPALGELKLCQQRRRDRRLSCREHEIVERLLLSVRGRVVLALAGVVARGLFSLGLLRLSGLVVLRLLRRRQRRRARRQDEPARQRRVGLRHLVAPGQGGGRAGHPQGQERRAKRGDAQRGGDRAERLDHVLACADGRQPSPGRRDLVRAVGGRDGGLARGDAVQVDAEREPVEQRLRRPLVLGQALVERHHAEPAGVRSARPSRSSTTSPASRPPRGAPP
jgi:hypothetical protein